MSSSDVHPSWPRPSLLLLCMALSMGCAITDEDLDAWFYGAYPDVASTDLLFVVDNSSSMSQEAGALGTSADAFVDAVSDGSVDYRIAITTTTPDDKASNGMDPGEGGRLIGPPILKDDPDVAGAFREAMLCDTIFWPSDTPRSNAGTVTDCSTVPEAGITQEYLDCVCGFDLWKDFINFQLYTTNCLVQIFGGVTPCASPHLSPTLPKPRK